MSLSTLKKRTTRIDARKTDVALPAASAKRGCEALAQDKRDARPEPDAFLRVRGLRVTYDTMEGTVHAVNGLHFGIQKGESLGLVGETGAGKTTTALSIMRLVPTPVGKITAGEIWHDGKDLLKLRDKEMQRLRGDRISMIFQNPMASLNPVHTVGEQIMEVLRRHQTLSKGEARDMAAAMLNKVGILENRMDGFPFEFSGGMQQRVSIAMALACQPQLLIADEPTTALDVTIQAQVLELMKELKKDFGSSMLLITHDFGLVAEVCDKVAVMYAGVAVESGTLEHIFNNALHPYTEGLFNSIPKIDESLDRLRPIKGLSPNPIRLPGGCPFHPRCPYAMDICAREAPQETQPEPGHRVLCWRCNDGN